MIYPFIELGLGLCFLFRFQITTALILTIVILGITTIGVTKIINRIREPFNVLVWELY